jgi:hypothetical protein
MPTPPDETIGGLPALPLPLQSTDELVVQRPAGADFANRVSVLNTKLVTGPAAATNSAVALYDGTGGKLLKDGPVLGNSATKDVGTAAGTVAAGNAAPNAHATSHATAGSDPVTPAAIGAAAAAKFIAGAGALTGPAAPLTIGTAAANATGDFATAAQGGKADTAVQPAAIANMVTAAAALTDTALVVASGGAKGVAVSTLSAAFVKATAGVPAEATMNTGVLLGRTTALAGAVEEIGVGSGLSLSAGLLSFSGQASVGPGIDFFLASPVITAAGAGNAIPILTLSRTPVVTAEQTIAGTGDGASTPIAFAAWLYNTALGRTTIDGGVWQFETWAAINNNSGITTLTRQVYSVVPAVTGNVTITGAGASRTATASAGTPFAVANIDASATSTTASYLQTPTGLYQITARTSDTVVTIATPAGYSNEAAVAFNVWKKIVGGTTQDISDTGTNYQLNTVNAASAAVAVTALTKLGSIGFVTSNSSRVVTITYDGTQRNSHFSSPLATMHNELPGLQGGTSGEYNHLTNAQATNATAAQAQGTASIRAISTATPQPIGTAAAGNGTDVAAGNHVHAIPADAVTNAMLANMAANTVKVNATASSDNPTDVAMAASTVLARLASGNIVAATVLEVQQLANPFTEYTSLTTSDNMPTGKHAQMIVLGGSGAQVLTFPTGLGYTAGQWFSWRCTNTTNWTFTAGAGATVKNRGTALKTAGETAYGGVYCTGTDAYEVYGDTTT